MALASPTFHVPPVNEVNGLKSLNALNNHFPDLNTISDNQTNLVVSPYTESVHRLRLDTVDAQSSLLAKALTALQPLRHDYATAPYLESFNWSEIISNLSTLIQSSGIFWKRQRFFVVVFRSQISPSTNYDDLGALDKAAHEEATSSGGFLKYWFGSPDVEGRNLATCLWVTQEHAKRGGTGPAHRRAAGAARHNYASWGIERLGLVIEDDVESWELETWIDGY